MAERLILRREKEKIPKNVSIKREKYRGKFYVTLRENKKFIERVQWTPSLTSKKAKKGGTNLRSAIINYNQDRSIQEYRKRIREKNWNFTTEYNYQPVKSRIENKKLIRSDTTPKISRRRNQPYQYYVEGYLDMGSYVTEIVASSQKHDSDYPIEAAREEAWTSFYEKAHFAMHGQKEGYYDAEEGRKLVEAGKITAQKEGIIHYTRR